MNRILIIIMFLFLSIISALLSIGLDKGAAFLHLPNLMLINPTLSAGLVILLGLFLTKNRVLLKKALLFLVFAVISYPFYFLFLPGSLLILPFFYPLLGILTFLAAFHFLIKKLTILEFFVIGIIALTVDIYLRSMLIELLMQGWGITPSLMILVASIGWITTRKNLQKK